ncbi:MAG: hypothetical protein L0H84_04530 [Pseudonocardia sp.]|nr:hypothetical protein [Pseudonocardia sp.]
MSSRPEEYGAIADRLAAVERQVIGMGVKLDLLLEQLAAGHQDHEARLRALEHRDDPPSADHEARLRQLERWMWIAAGTALAGGGALGTAASLWLGAG